MLLNDSDQLFFPLVFQTNLFWLFLELFQKRNRNRNKKASPKPEASAVVDPTDLQNPPSVPEITPQDPVPCIAESSKSDQVQTNVPKSQSEVTAPSQANAEISKITEESNPQSCVIPPQEKTGIPKNKMPEAKKDEKSREEVMAEREAKKAAKKAAKGNDAPAKSKDQDHKPSAPTEEGTPPSPAATIAPKKSKEEILAEREAKKAEKAARRAKVLEGKDTTDGGKPKEVSKAAPAEKNKQAAVKTEESGKSKAELKAERRAKQEAQRASKMAAAAGGDDNKAAATATDQAAGLSGKAKISGQRVPDEIQADR